MGKLCQEAKYFTSWGKETVMYEKNSEDHLNVIQINDHTISSKRVQKLKERYQYSITICNTSPKLHGILSRKCKQES